MTYNPAPVCYGPKAPIEALLDPNGVLASIGDSLASKQANLESRIPYALAMCCNTWNSRIGLLDCPSKITGADGAYNLNTSDRSNTGSLCQIQFSISGGSGSSGARDLPGLWVCNEDQLPVNGGYQVPPAAADFAHYTLGRNHPFAVEGGATATGANAEYYRQVFGISAWEAKSLNKLVGATGKLGMRYLCVAPSGGTTADNISRRLVDVAGIAVGTTTTLTAWPTIRFSGGTFWKPGPGNALDAAATTLTYGGVLNAYRGDSADASGLINAMGDFVLNPDGSGDYAVAVRGSSAIASGRWLPAFGAPLYALDVSNNFEGGKQFFSWGTNSAQYDDIGGTGTAKNVSEARLARGLYLSAVDLSSTIVFIYSFGDEGAGTQAAVEAMVQVCQSAAETAGYSPANIHHVLFTNMWRDCGQPTEALNSGYVEASRTAHRNAVDSLTAAGLSVANVSVYDATDGVPLNGGAAAIAYMASYDAFEWGDGQTADLTGGDLLDAGEGHPSDAGGPFFATKALDAMQDYIATETFHPGAGVTLKSFAVSASWVAFSDVSEVFDVTIIAAADNAAEVSIRIDGGDAQDLPAGAEVRLEAADISRIEVSGTSGDLVLVGGNTRSSKL